MNKNMYVLKVEHDGCTYATKHGYNNLVLSLAGEIASNLNHEINDASGIKDIAEFNGLLFDHIVCAEEEVDAAMLGCIYVDHMTFLGHVLEKSYELREVFYASPYLVGELCRIISDEDVDCIPDYVAYANMLGFSVNVTDSEVYRIPEYVLRHEEMPENEEYYYYRYEGCVPTGYSAYRWRDDAYAYEVVKKDGTLFYAY